MQVRLDRHLWRTRYRKICLELPGSRRTTKIATNQEQIISYAWNVDWSPTIQLRQDFNRLESHLIHEISAYYSAIAHEFVGFAWQSSKSIARHDDAVILHMNESTSNSVRWFRLHDRVAVEVNQMIRALRYPDFSTPRNLLNVFAKFIKVVECTHVNDILSTVG